MAKPTNPYAPPNEIEAKQLQPLRVKQAGGLAIILSLAHGVLLSLSTEWFMQFDFYSYQIRPEDAWIDNLRHYGVSFVLFAPLVLAAYMLIVRTPIWLPMAATFVWIIAYSAWLYLFLHQCVTRGGENAMVTMVGLAWLSMGMSLAAHRLSLHHHKEQKESEGIP